MQELHSVKCSLNIRPNLYSISQERKYSLNCKHIWQALKYLYKPHRQSLHSSDLMYTLKFTLSNKYIISLINVTVFPVLTKMAPRKSFSYVHCIKLFSNSYKKNVFISIQSRYNLNHSKNFILHIFQLSHSKKSYFLVVHRFNTKHAL